MEGGGTRQSGRGLCGADRAREWRGKQRKRLQRPGGEEVGKLTISLSETSLNFLRWRSVAAWRSSVCTPPPTPLLLPDVLHASPPDVRATLGPSGSSAWCLGAQARTWIRSGLITCPCACWQMNPIRSWPWRPWRNWTGVWTSWRPFKPTGPLATWLQIR